MATEALKALMGKPIPMDESKDEDEDDGLLMKAAKNAVDALKSGKEDDAAAALLSLVQMAIED